MPAQLQALRELLEQRFPDALPLTHQTAPVVPTGSVALDRVFPQGGLPRGRLTSWTPGGGASALLRSACRATVAREERAAWVDAARTLTGQEWESGVTLARPAGRGEALECAEELARSGAYALVVLAGAPTADAERVRLSRAAHEGGSALVTLDRGGFMAAIRLASRVEPDAYRWRTDTVGDRMGPHAVSVRVRATALGWSKEVQLVLGIRSHDLRLSVDPRLGDRRGAAAR